MNKKVSVIIPVYNAARYLERSVNSVISQTYPQWELILVDDGSTDGSGQICDGFAQRDRRVRAIHQENAGAGMARNKGIAQAKGDYIVFVDADDTIEKDYMMRLSKHDEDVVFIDVDDIDGQGRVVGSQKMSAYKHLSQDEILRQQMTGRLSWGGVRKCVKRQLLTENNIWYSNHRIGEEAIYSYLVLRHAKSVGFIDGVVYHYLQHGDSLSNSAVDDPWGGVALALRCKVKDEGDYSQYADTLNAFIETAGVVAAYKMAARYSLPDYLERADSRWKQMREALDRSVAVGRKHQALTMRLYGLLCRSRQWPLAWAVGRLMQRKRR